MRMNGQREKIEFFVIAFKGGKDSEQDRKGVIEDKVSSRKEVKIPMTEKNTCNHCRMESMV